MCCGFWCRYQLNHPAAKLTAAAVTGDGHGMVLPMPRCTSSKVRQVQAQCHAHNLT
jgi:hypothetical protein